MKDHIALNMETSLLITIGVVLLIHILQSHACKPFVLIQELFLICDELKYLKCVQLSLFS